MKKFIEELWAVVDKDGYVKMTRGGSSTTSRLMVYQTKEAAEKVLANHWTKQVIPNRDDVEVKQIYRRTPCASK